jgi:hypothetical protein
VKGIVKEIKSRIDKKSLVEMSETERGEIEELIKAIRNLIRYSNLLQVPKFNS